MQLYFFSKYEYKAKVSAIKVRENQRQCSIPCIHGELREVVALEDEGGEKQILQNPQR